MTFDLSIPLAEQYPSKMAVSSVVASQRISGTAHLAEKARRMPEGRAGAKYGGRNTGKHLAGFLLSHSRVQAKQRITFRPFRLCNLAVAQLRKRADRHADFISNLRLRQTMRLYLSNDFVPVHINLFSISRNTTLRQVEMQVKDN